MNVSDLVAALHEQADEMDTTRSPQLAGIHARVHRARRRRAIAGAVAGGVAVAAAAVLVIVLPRGDNQPEPAAPQTLVFPERMGGYHLVAARTGHPGDGRIALTLPKPSRGFGITVACRGPHEQLDTRLVVNGTGVGGIFCTPNPHVLSEKEPTFLEEDLKANGVALGDRSLVLSLTLVRGRFTQTRANDPDALLGFAVYERDR